MAASLASLGDRALAVLLDLLVLGAIFWTAGMALTPRLGGLTLEGFNLRGWAALLVIGISAVGFLAYHVCLEWWFGATLGKFVAGARITGIDGGRIDFRQVLIRNLLRVVEAVPLYLVAAILVILTKKRQRLGDVAARTVVTTRDYPGAARVAALLALVALPVASIAGTWSLRAPAAGGPITPTAASKTTATPPTTRPVAKAIGSASGSTAGGWGQRRCRERRPGRPDAFRRERAAHADNLPGRRSEGSIGRARYEPGERDVALRRIRIRYELWRDRCASGTRPAIHSTW
jgi:uncharacterized RDD family membrane protein YckC